MAEENIQSEQAVSEQAASEQAVSEQEVSEQEAPGQEASGQEAPLRIVEAAASPASNASKKGDSLLVFLTVLMILVGIVDVILWGVAGYYFFQNSKSEAPAAQDVSTGGAPAENAASGGGETSDNEAEREALEAYIREISDMLELENEMLESHAKAIEADAGADAYAELTERTIPLCQQMNERVLKITSRDSEIGELCEMHRDYVTRFLNSLNMLVSAVENGDTALVNEANNLINEANDVARNHTQKLQALAEERNVSLNG